METKYALFALMIIGLSFAGLSISDYELSPEVVEPGTSGFLQITVENTGTQTDTVENVAIVVSSNTGLGIDRSFVVGDLEAGSEVMISLPFSASEDVESGFYTVEVKASGRTLEYYYGSDGQLKSKTESFEKHASIPIEVVEQPVITVSLGQESIEDITESTLTFTNAGGPAKRVEVILLNEGIGFLNAGKLYLDDLEVGATLEATIDARGAEEGATKLELQLTYQNELGTEVTEVLEIPITVKKTEGDFVFVQSEPVVSGDKDTLELVLTNEGNALSNVRITFGTEEVRLRGLNEYVVGSLGAGEAKALSIPLVADLAPGTQNVVLDVTWEESGENRVGSITLPLEIVSDATVGVYLEAKTNPLSAGSENTLSVTVSNLGTYDIQGTTVRLESEAFELNTIQPEQFIGELESDDYSSVQYDITMNRVEPGEYPAIVRVEFRDASGEWISVEKEIPITINGMSFSDAELEEQSGFGINLDIPVIIGTVIVGGVAYWLIKKRKKKKPVQAH